jgi:hypothetical protein
MNISSKKAGSRVSRRRKVHRVDAQETITIPAWQSQGDWADLKLQMDGRIYFIRLTAVQA